MKARAWIGVTLAMSTATAAFTSCKHGASPGTGGSSASSSSVAASGTGGGGTGGGSGGSGTAGAGGATPDAGSIVCLATYTNDKGGPCDLLQQNCPPGKTCTPVPGGAGMTTECLSAGGIKTAGQPCYSPDECDAKLVCIGGKCVAFCCDDAASQPCNGGLCITHVSLDSADTFYAYVCSYGQRCTLLTPNACPPGLNCYVEDPAQGLAVCDDRSPTPVSELGACNFLNDCESMQDCYAAPGINGGVCLWYCDVMGPNKGAAPGLGGCPTGETCQDVYGGKSIKTGVSGVGLCIPNGGIMQPDGG